MKTSKELREEFDKKFGKKTKFCQCCGLDKCDHSTTGCPWYVNKYWTEIDSDGFCSDLDQEELFKFIEKALKAQKREIVERIGEMPEGYVIWRYDGNVYGGQAKYMSGVYVDDYPVNIVMGITEILSLLKKGKK